MHAFYNAAFDRFITVSGGSTASAQHFIETSDND